MIRTLPLLFVLLSACAAGGDLDSTTNRAPIAKAGTDLVVSVGEEVVLSGHSSYDRDQDPLTYKWSLVPPETSVATLESKTDISARFVPDTPGDFVVTLVVNDGFVNSEPDTITVTALANQAPYTSPVADAGQNQSVLVGQLVQLDGSSSTADGDIVFSWRFLTRPTGSSAGLNSQIIARPSFVPDRAGTYLLELKVSDGVSTSTPSAVEIVATAQNNPPLANAGPDLNVNTGTRVQLIGSASTDPDGDQLIYRWTMLSKPSTSLAALSSTDAVNPSFTADRDGEYRVQLVVNDGFVDSVPDVVVVIASTINIAPTAHAGLNRVVPVGQQTTLDGSASHDPNGDELTFLWSSLSRPAGSQAALFDATTVSARFVPDVPGPYVFQLLVSDGEFQSTPASVTITATQNNSPPSANAGPDQAVITGTTVNLDGRASQDPDGDSLTYAWQFSARPQGSAAVLSSSTNATPTFVADRDGTYVLQLIVFDSIAYSQPDSMIVTAFTPGAPQPVKEGDVVITEYMRDPDTLSDFVGEWFEIYNPTGTLWNLKNCVLEDLGTNRHTIVADLEIPPGQYRVLARSNSPGFVPDYVYSSFELANNDDEIIILCNGSEIAQIAYDATWPKLVGRSNQLLRSKYDEVENDNPANWCPSTVSYNGDFGTPGTQNEFWDACP